MKRIITLILACIMGTMLAANVSAVWDKKTYSVTRDIETGVKLKTSYTPSVSYTSDAGYYISAMTSNASLSEEKSSGKKDLAIEFRLTYFYKPISNTSLSAKYYEYGRRFFTTFLSHFSTGRKTLDIPLPSNYKTGDGCTAYTFLYYNADSTEYQTGTLWGTNFYKMTFDDILADNGIS